MTSDTQIQDFFKNRTIFITGATGFMGKVLVEKLLYSCSGLKEILIIIRPKKGKDVEERISQMLSLPLFDRIHKEKPEVLKKIKVFNGDVSWDSFGLKNNELDYIIKNTSILFHMAASLKLEANLKDNLKMNTTVTKRLLNFACQMKNLITFVHVSTAFCCVEQDISYERVYSCQYNPEDLIKIAEWIDVKTLDNITPELLGSHSNTYTYSKRLAEVLVKSYYPSLPVVIARPSIVTPAAFQPVPGWVDNLNGPVGLMIGCTKGIIRSVLGDLNCTCECIPVDVAINCLIAIAYTNAKTTEKRPDEIPVYNVTDKNLKVNWLTVMKTGNELLLEYPMEAGLWYPNYIVTTNKLKHYFNFILFQIIPAYLLDFLLLCFGQRRFMVRLQDRIKTGVDYLGFFTVREWDFRNDKLKEMSESLSKEDKKMFYTEVANIDMREYLKAGLLGARQFCLKEPLSSLPKARKQLKRMYILDCVCKTIFVVLLLWMIARQTNIFQLIFAFFGF